MRHVLRGKFIIVEDILVIWVIIHDETVGVLHHTNTHVGGLVWFGFFYLMAYQPL